eukprot:TRINITY_DN4330_c0_g1_i1.p1 TRINITY_DN4330_c0_g1~~TRINITY_DN4330_c0_g1_i1.p1  ORF type:complete len:287 (-),score=53.09 TRINITY_DN4330_c0_g1_i1:113-973(-)
MFDAFGCTNIGPDGTIYLNAHPEVICNASLYPYNTILALSILAIVYTLALPSVILYILRHARDTLTTKVFGIQLIVCYREKCYWWDAVLITERLMLTMLLSVIPFTTVRLTVISVTMLLLLCLVLQYHLRPFRSALENNVMLIVLYVLLLSFIGAYVATTGNVAGFKSSGPAISYCVIVLNVVTTFGLIALLILVFGVAVSGRLTNMKTFANIAAIARVEKLRSDLEQRLLRPQDHRRQGKQDGEDVKEERRLSEALNVNDLPALTRDGKGFEKMNTPLLNSDDNL